MLELILLFIGSVLLYRYWKAEYSAMAKTIDLIPGPPKTPFLGTVLDPDDILRSTAKNIEIYGRVHRFWILSDPIVCISSPAAAERLLTSKVNVNKGFYEMLEPWLGNGILLSEEQEWKFMRRLLTPAFHFKILDNFVDVFNKNAAILTQVLAKEIEQSKTQEINIVQFMKRCTLDIICETAMGVSINAQLETDSEYLRVIARVTDAILSRTYSTWRLAPHWLYMLLSSEGRQFRKDVTVLHNFTKQVIQSKKRSYQDNVESDESGDAEDLDNGYNGKKKRAFLDLILSAARGGAELSDTSIQNEVDSFMFAGHDTTSITVIMFLYCMATHPQYQKLVQEELDQVFEKADDFCSMNDVTNLKYLDRCLKESQRLYSTVPNITRKISEDLELDGYKVPAGASISLQMYFLHRNPEYFPDPLTYDPDRFLPDRCVGRHPFAFVPFSAGPRNCLGQKFATLEAKVIISTLLRKFNFSYSPDRDPLRIEADLVLKFLDGVPLIITPRC